ncbi:MAG: GNAT family N-acetyltransferase [Limimaricola sp.]|uniref:GNAT family N-acetyltransferase n=1 Tax=Limimaricola sp. TaxID=2211665 RepID=UPI001DA5BF84|nr:GNAT family N-acetyltransferase [Limimaricola sp.]MBI1416019.1 GNAT family N-acetyltransferase [Limimaricola sp.]
MTGLAISLPTLETERLVLRPPALRDFEAYAAFLASDRAAGIGGPRPRDMAFGDFCALIGHWHLRGYGRWVVADRHTDAALGVVGLMLPEGWPEPEIAWSVFAGAEGRGIAREAAIRARRYAYETLGWTRVVSCTKADNLRSIALARRLGAVHEYDHDHPRHGRLLVWRHLSPAELGM